MPHLTLEYSNNIKEKIEAVKLFMPCHQILKTVASINPQNCKSRALVSEFFCVGEGKPEQAFIHLEILLAERKPLVIRQEIAQKILGILNNYFSYSLQELHLQISVLVKEFSRNLYYKTQS